MASKEPKSLDDVAAVPNKDLKKGEPNLGLKNLPTW
jgi:hypothetical protein